MAAREALVHVRKVFLFVIPSGVLTWLFIQPLYHMECYEKIVDSSSVKFLDCIEPLTRNNC